MTNHLYQKNNLQKKYYGKIICIDNQTLTIKQNNSFISFSHNDYYIFLKKSKSLKNDDNFLNHSLKSCNCFTQNNG